MKWYRFRQEGERLASRGMALIAVLWIVAALSIISTGITRSLRAEGRMLNVARQTVQAQALGEGAIQIALQAFVANNQPLRQVLASEVLYGGMTIPVEIQPLNGFIDINAAKEALLEQLFTVAGGLPSSAAQQLAQAVIQTRENRDASGRPQRFESEEELMRVPGVDYGLYARLSPFLTADLRGSGRVNPLAASIDVLSVLAGGDMSVASQIASARATQGGVDLSTLDGTFLDSSAVRSARVQARVLMADGVTVRVTRSVDFSARAQDGSPWSTFRTSAVIEPLQHQSP